MSLLIALGLFLALGNLSNNIPELIDSLSTKPSFPSSYEFKIYDGLLKRHVKHGLVDYASLKRDPDLNAAYKQLKETSPEKLKGTLERVSFWINTFNFLTIKCIVDRYPIKELGQESASKRFIVGGKLYSLNQIKDEVLPELIKASDWRAIFLLCNGQISAPFIKNYAYTPANFSDECERSQKSFILNKSNYLVNERARVFSISPFYRSNLQYINLTNKSPFAIVNDFFPPEKQLNLDAVEKNYAIPYDRRINDLAWLKIENIASPEKVSSKEESHGEKNEKEN